MPYSISSKRPAMPFHILIPRTISVLDSDGHLFVTVPMFTENDRLGLDCNKDLKACEAECLQRAEALLATLNKS